MDQKSQNSFSIDRPQPEPMPSSSELPKEQFKPVLPPERTESTREHSDRPVDRREIERMKEGQQESYREPQPEGFLDETIEALKRRLRKPKQQKPTHIPQVKDELTVQVEKILEEGLGDVYKELTPVQQQEFKIQGEKAAWEIRTLLRSTKVKVKRIFILIVEWLKIMPGINRFFLMQEAKIKTDRIIALAEQQRHSLTPKQ